MIVFITSLMRDWYLRGFSVLGVDPIFAGLLSVSDVGVIFVSYVMFETWVRSFLSSVMCQTWV